MPATHAEAAEAHDTAAAAHDLAAALPADDPRYDAADDEAIQATDRAWSATDEVYGGLGPGSHWAEGQTPPARLAADDAADACSDGDDALAAQYHREAAAAHRAAQ